MNLGYKIILIILCLLFTLSTLIAFFTHSNYVESRNEILFESNTLFVLVFIFVISRNTILDNRFIKVGFIILILIQLYDLLTEINFLGAISDQYNFLDSLIEDGGLQVAYLLIAFGITEMVKQINEEASIDELTGLYNRKKLSSIEMSKFDLIYLDLDGLKKINDSRGHAEGDLLIIQFARSINKTLSRNEQAFRIGGDEFVITARPDEGANFIERLKCDLKSNPISFSYGIETTSKDNFYQALERTDQEMYKMKIAQRKKR